MDYDGYEPMHVVDREAFQALVDEVVGALPTPFRERIENLHFAVEGRANPADYGLGGTLEGGTLLGVYRGVPLPRRTSGYNLSLPDLIVIFQEPLQRLARDEEHLSALVRHTVQHEIAHYFGISDRRLRELDAY